MDRLIQNIETDINDELANNRSKISVNIEQIDNNKINILFNIGNRKASVTSKGDFSATDLRTIDDVLYNFGFEFDESPSPDGTSWLASRVSDMYEDEEDVSKEIAESYKRMFRD